MIVLIAKNVLKEGKKEAFLEIARIMVEETQKEPGCLLYDLVMEEENIYYFVEKYENQAAVEAHRASAYFQTYVPKMKALQEASALTTCEVVEFL